MRNVWLGLGLMLALSSCAAVAASPLAAPVPPVSAAAKATPVSWAGVTFTEAIATCSEIFQDRRPVGFHLMGKATNGQMLTVSYEGMEPVSPGTGDVDVLDDTMIARLNPVRGHYEIQETGAAKAPVTVILTAAERAQLQAAINRSLSANPEGRNYNGQSRKVVLAFAKRIVDTPRAGG
ncbi:MAG: hypothetical protein H7338_17960 [Candidatus Sericytochromatia bacterium]|nr:hypothetical protein [Candidatus Sericytochromatia bacterium]